MHIQEPEPGNCEAGSHVSGECMMNVALGQEEVNSSAFLSLTTASLRNPRVAGT
jgi:hypothetical protein